MDANGKTWQLSDLKGKVTLVNVWATWCGPCREELPNLQSSSIRVHERKDLAVITLNTDENPGMPRQFLRESNYTFPVLPANEYVSRVVPTVPSKLDTRRACYGWSVCGSPMEATSGSLIRSLGMEKTR
jgi:thiol-disulfide isomerase/thioredoxin